MKAVILFDGVCNFCSKSVQFIIKRETQSYFRFASLQGEVGQSLLKKHQVPSHVDSFVLIENNQVYLKSDAALRICKHLKGAWKLMSIFLIVPKPIRNAVYSLIAKNRYKFYGKRDSCMIPSPEIRERFLD
ncbi:thiol-disulfide oxidoreductase DCC family protein [Novibacillus thermophilus]|jgi:predicted DCC family thiol-disulfide oxidoreductase YuxK|uniref:Thiol-disulfide oxidoreductase n=1 Tax=Novibacillus thermophilus TaxID=1471761 RepID=A0A1U9K959_9BACL|nr:thiol-disulfide oxidoreductase DCC family protein [Novibacillus thermophilus]AQS56560.1 thiol-disulfide oxidoreductase [Novibacillus thermophilus]